MNAKTLPAKLADPAPARWGRFAVIHDVNAGADGVPLKGLRGLARVSFLQVLLEGARACYLRWDAYRFAADEKAEEYGAEVQARLDFLLLASSLLPVALSATDKRVKEGIHTTASDLLHNLGKGWDYFGNAENYVPIGSPKTYLPPFQKAVGLLEQREKTYLDLLQSLDDRKLLSQRRDAAVSSAKDELGDKQELIGKLQARLIQITKELTPEGDSESEVRIKRRALVEALDGLENWLRECSGLTIQDYADCIFNLAFVNSEFTGLTTLASQAIKLADKAKNTLPNDDGQAINRKHMLLRVDTFSKRLSRLDEAWEVIGAVTRSTDPQLVALKDEDAYRLLVERTEFNNLFEQFYAKDEARKAMGAMDEYVEAVQQRNAVLAQYNALVSEYLSVAGDFRTTSAQKEEVEKLQADAAAPGLLAATAFASALYNRMRETCIRSAYDACRALRFWTLKPDRTLYETFKLGTPGAIDHQFLSGVVQNLEFDKMFGKITDDLEHWVSRTPTKQEDYTGTGVCVMLKQDQYPHEFKQLRESGVARFSVPLPRIGYERFRLRLHSPLPGRAKTVTTSELREALRGAKILLILSKVGSRTDETIRIAGDKDTPVQIEVHVTERTGEPDVLIVRAVKEGIAYAYCTVRDEGPGTSPKSGRIAALRQRHRSLFAQPRPKPGDAREQIIDDVAAIAGKIDARHQSLVIVSSHGWDLFDTPPSPQFTIRVFDERGKLAAEATEAGLRNRRGAAKVDAFKERLRPFWKRPSLTWEEEQRIIEDVAGVLDQKALWEPKTKTNSFDGHAEVRVTKVRAWVFGVTSDDMKCHVDLKHMGNEVFRRADGSIIGLTHGPIDGIRFSYNWSNVLWNVPGGYVEKPEVSLKHDGIDADLLLQGKYANADNIPLIGPFAEWEIRIESGKHKNLDRSKITSICLDFHVLSKAITTGPLPPAPAR